MIAILLLLLGAQLLWAETALYTTGSYTGNMGDRSVVDAICNASIPAGCVAGYAMLLYDGESILDLPIPASEVVSMGGSIIASGWNSELYNATYSGPFWSGYSPSGSSMTCSNWTSTAACTKGAAGGALGLQTFTLECNRERPLLCYCTTTTSRPSQNPTTTRPSTSPSTTRPSLQPTTTFPTNSPSTSRPSSNPTRSPTRSPTAAVYTQQGSKLVGTGNAGISVQGLSSVISADGTTLAHGGAHGVWVFVRSGSTWTQQAGPLYSIEGESYSYFNNHLAISDDGNTLAMGNDPQTASQNSVVVFVRSGVTWSEQAFLQPVAIVFFEDIVHSLALSSDGNTLAIGIVVPTQRDELAIYTRSGSTWSLQDKVSEDVYHGNSFGCAVSLSSNGDDLAVGARDDGDGKVYVYHRTGVTWSEVSFSSPYAATGFQFGAVVSLSGDGLTLAVGSWGSERKVFMYTRANVATAFALTQTISSPDPALTGFGRNVYLSQNGLILAAASTDYNSNIGTAFIYQYSGGSWSMLRAFFNPSGYTGAFIQFGYSISLSSTGAYFIGSGPNDNSNTGATWVFNNPLL